MSKLSQEAAIYVTHAIQEKIQKLRNEDIPGADKLSISDEQTQGCREYFKSRVKELQGIIAEMEGVLKDFRWSPPEQ